MNLNLSVLDGIEEVDSLESVSKDKPLIVTKDDDKLKDDPKDDEPKDDPRVIKEIDDINSINNDKPDDTVVDDDTAPNDSIKEVFKLTAGLVRDKGFIEFEETDLESAEDPEEFLSSKLVEKFNNDLNTQIEEYKQARDPRVRRILELEDEGFDLDKILAAEAKVQNLEKIDPTKIRGDESLAEHIHTQYLLRQGMDQTEIKEEIETLKLDGKLEDRATKSYPKLKQLAEKEAQQAIKDQEKEKQEAINNYKSTLKNVEDFFTKTDKILDIPVPEADRKKLFKLYSETGKDGKTELQRIREKNPLEFDLKIAYLASNNFDLSKIKNNIKNTVLKEVKQKVAVNKEPQLGKLDYTLLKKALNIK